MAQQTINVGSSPDDGTGDPAQTAFTKCNDNFTELYARGGGTPGPPQGRLVLTGVSSVLVSTVTAQGTLYYMPHVGNLVPIYDGTNFAMMSIGTAISAAMTDTTKSPAAIGASKVNDWFVWNDAGTIRIGHGPDWTSDTARSAGTALVMVNGILLNAVTITNACGAQRGTYVGTTRSNASSTLDWKYGTVATPPGETWFGVWNAYNRVDVSGYCGEASTNWTYSSTTPRPANNQATYRASFIVGLSEDACQGIYGAGGATTAVIGIGFDATNAFHASSNAASASGGFQIGLMAHSTFVPAIGWHFMQALEAIYSAGTGDFYSRLLGTQAKLAFSFRM